VIARPKPLVPPVISQTLLISTSSLGSPCWIHPAAARLACPRPDVITNGYGRAREGTDEAIVGGQGICLLAAGNAPLIAREGVITRPVRGLSPSQLALAWRTGDHRPLVADYARACQAAQRT
jgi:hypothetical protein